MIATIEKPILRKPNYKINGTREGGEELIYQFLNSRYPTIRATSKLRRYGVDLICKTEPQYSFVECHVDTEAAKMREVLIQMREGLTRPGFREWETQSSRVDLMAIYLPGCEFEVFIGNLPQIQKLIEFWEMRGVNPGEEVPVSLYEIS